MGPSQSSHLQHQFQFHQLFPDSTGFKLLNNSQSNVIHQHLHYTYRQQSTGKKAEIRSYTVQSNKKQNIEAYFNSRVRAIKSPYLFQLFNSKITQSKQISLLGNLKSNQPSSNLCTMTSVRMRNSQFVQYSTLWLLVETSNFSLEDQIMNRVNKKPFQEIQLWSVLSSSVLGAVTLLQNGFKQPVLSPKGIALSQDGTIKVGEWQLVSDVTSKQSIEQGEVIFGKLGHCQTISQQSKDSLNQLLTKYYWAPQGLKYLEQFVSIGKKQINSSTARSARFASYPNPSAGISSTKFQIFSLGMTLITMCLRNCYYRSQTFSQKYLSKLLHQAIQIRRVEGKELSKQLKFLIEAMIKWDSTERISYLQLKDSIIRYLNKQSEFRESSISLKTNDNNENSNLNSVRTKNKNRTFSQGSNLSTIQLTQSGQTSFTDANYFTLNQEAGSSRNQTFSHNAKRKHLQSVASSCANEGSGMIEQGNGDDDWNLQSQKQQTVIQRSVQSENSSTSSPITHRTEKQLLTNNQNSPFDKINQDKPGKIICPASTPILTPSSKQSDHLCTSKEPISQVGQKMEKMPKHKTNHVYLQSPDQSPEQNKQKKQKIPTLKLSNINNFSISKENFMLNNLSNRGSYRSLNKQPPNIKSARISSEIDHEALLNASQNIKLKDYSKNSQDEVKIYPQNQIILHFQDRLPQNVSELQIDQEDAINNQISYEYFTDEVDLTDQKENPDIFETFDQQSMLHYSNASRQVISQMGSSATQRSYKLQPSDIKVTVSNLKLSLNLTQIPINYENNRKILFRADEGRRNTRITEGEKKQEQFMTFNKKATNVEEHVNSIQLNTYVPSKWQKDKTAYQWMNGITKLQKSKIKVEQNDEKDQQLFTDPKLMQYIRSPVQKFNKNMTSSIECISQFNNNSYESSIFNSSQSKQNKQNINDYVNMKKQTTSPIALLDMKAIYEASRYKNAEFKNIEEDKYQKMQYYENYDSHASKIVKQRGARGFYEGEKKNGLRSGYGIFYYNQGGKYRGNWLNNKMHGRGTLEYADGRVAYQGQWSNDELHGKGILYNQSPNFINHQMNYSNLDEMDECWIFYQGMFQHDDKCGMGLLVLSNQEQFVGQFKDDMAEGMGQYLRLNGSVVKGIWHKNKLVKIIEQHSNQVS